MILEKILTNDDKYISPFAGCTEERFCFAPKITLVNNETPKTEAKILELLSQPNEFQISNYNIQPNMTIGLSDSTDGKH